MPYFLLEGPFFGQGLRETVFGPRYALFVPGKHSYHKNERKEGMPMTTQTSIIWDTGVIVSSKSKTFCFMNQGISGMDLKCVRNENGCQAYQSFRLAPIFFAAAGLAYLPEASRRRD